MVTLELKIEGMMCGHCKAFVTNAFKDNPGVSVVEVDLTSSIAKITYDENQTKQALLRLSLEDSNYSII